MGMIAEIDEDGSGWVDYDEFKGLMLGQTPRKCHQTISNDPRSYQQQTNEQTKQPTNRNSRPKQKLINVGFLIITNTVDIHQRIWLEVDSIFLFKNEVARHRVNSMLISIIADHNLKQTNS